MFCPKSGFMGYPELNKCWYKKRALNEVVGNVNIALACAKQLLTAIAATMNVQLSYGTSMHDF